MMKMPLSTHTQKYTHALIHAHTEKQILPSPVRTIQHKACRLGLWSLLLLWPNFHLNTSLWAPHHQDGWSWAQPQEFGYALFFSLLSPVSQPHSPCFMLQKLSICCRSMLLRKKGRKETFGPCLGSARALICLSKSFSRLLQWIGGKRGKATDTGTLILDCRGWRINGIGGLFVICLSRKHSCFPSSIPPGFFLPQLKQLFLTGLESGSWSVRRVLPRL